MFANTAQLPLSCDIKKALLKHNNLADNTCLSLQYLHELKHYRRLVGTIKLNTPGRLQALTLAR